MTISNEAVEAIRQAMAKGAYQMAPGELPYASSARRVAEAAAPIIRAEAIRAAAEDMREERHSWCLDDAGRYWIKRTLDELAERGRQ